MIKFNKRKSIFFSVFTGLYRCLSFVLAFFILYSYRDTPLNLIEIRFLIFLSVCVILYFVFTGYAKIQAALLGMEYFIIYCFAYVGYNILLVEIICIPPIIITLGFLLPGRICPIVIFAAGIIGPLFFSYGNLNDVSIMIGYYSLPYVILVLSLHIPVSMLSILLNRLNNQKETNRKSYIDLELENKKLNQTNHAISQRIFSLQNDSAQNERNRLSKEIHDTAGYVFINLIMMLQATQAILHRDIKKAAKLINDARDYAERGINEIRYLLRGIRSYSPLHISLQNEFFDIGKSFQKATDVEISIEYGNWPKSISEEFDSFFISFMQEALTNALKHGNAKQISVMCWFDGERVSMSISDNGCGAVFPINKGIGITAMEDLASQYGGCILINSNHGFKITAALPWVK